MSEILQPVRRGRVLELILNRPEKRNALDAALCASLVEAVEAAAADASIGSILLTANGKSFCAGMDLGEVAAGADSPRIAALHERLFTLIATLDKPLVAGVHGASLGGGTGLVANCHIVVADPDATFGLTEIRLGLWPLLVFRAVAFAMGERRTVELALTGRVFDADEAREYGLIHHVAGDPVGRAREIAAGLADASPTAIRMGLAYTRKARELDWQKAGELAQAVREEVFGSADFREGVGAFLEKRTPRWPSLGYEPNPEGLS
jgi:enoyl-CoA hydratase/carnithine racemase